MGDPNAFDPDAAAGALPARCSAASASAVAASAVTFVSQAAVTAFLAQRLGVAKKLLPVKNTRGRISKSSMVLNDATPNIEVDPETYEVRADGELLTCEPAKSLPHDAALFLVLEQARASLSPRRVGDALSARWEKVVRRTG
jgi:urease subunit alpha